MRRNLLLAIATIPLAILSVQGQGQRAVHGRVYYSRGEVAKDAAVQLKDTVTLQIISQITDSNGRYRFHGLDPDRDYEITATKKGYWSNTHRISRFDSKPVETVDLYLKPAK